MESILAKISVMLVPALLAVTLHEVAHGYTAERLGDPTARLLGRLTLNPLKHLDPIGTIALLFFGFGWARPVPVNFANLRRPRLHMVWVALAGPLTNLGLAVISALLLRVLAQIPDGVLQDGGMASRMFEPVKLMAGFSLYINIILAVFNLVPIPPLDGGRVMTGILPPRQAAMLARLEPFGFMIVILLIFFTDLWRIVLSPAISLMVGILAGPQTYLVDRAIQFLLAR
ncbi:putative Zn-dependent peptidase [Desulfuromonas soudanensis]|uniref:Putative Zn-dependent peptidase n=1 Tax=Desulfuromonas soudanensis TaxID=1603606 RepID=A0A0M4DHZ4_9BACT|nr:site-2 protease family protein [Desulfuromonas soudanensis]ALC16482.1 putative Zn-dependent peptidase [Desulfuromonas soudanensis]